jgi:hypothetical protein
MSEERRKILEMLAAGTITPDEAERLLEALGTNSNATETIDDTEPAKGKPKYLHVKVDADPGGDSCCGGRENVNIKIPLALLRAGVKLTSLIPEKARAHVSGHFEDHGINFDLKELDAEKLEALVKALSETSIDIESDKEKVKVYCA